MTLTALPDIAAESVTPWAGEQAALESHLEILEDELRDLRRIDSEAKAVADIQLQMARTLVGLDRGSEAWPLARGAFDALLESEDWESAVDACDILFLSEQADSLCALGQGIWLAVTYPIDPELSVELLSHVVDETPDDADGAAVAAATAAFLADIRAEGPERESLLFFTAQMLGNVARRHSGIETQEAFDQWMDRLELREPDKFLVRLRNVVEVLVQDGWWFDRDALQASLPPLEQ